MRSLALDIKISATSKEAFNDNNDDIILIYLYYIIYDNIHAIIRIEAKMLFQTFIFCNNKPKICRPDLDLSSL